MIGSARSLGSRPATRGQWDHAQREQRSAPGRHGTQRVTQPGQVARRLPYLTASSKPAGGRCSCPSTATCSVLRRCLLRAACGQGGTPCQQCGLGRASANICQYSQAAATEGVQAPLTPCCTAGSAGGPCTTAAAAALGLLVKIAAAGPQRCSRTPRAAPPVLERAAQQNHHTTSSTSPCPNSLRGALHPSIARLVEEGVGCAKDHRLNAHQHLHDSGAFALLRQPCTCLLAKCHASMPCIPIAPRQRAHLQERALPWLPARPGPCTKQ